MGGRSALRGLLLVASIAFEACSSDPDATPAAGEGAPASPILREGMGWRVIAAVRGGDGFNQRMIGDLRFLGRAGTGSGFCATERDLVLPVRVPKGFLVDEASRSARLGTTLHCGRGTLVDTDAISPDGATEFFWETRLGSTGLQLTAARGPFVARDDKPIENVFQLSTCGACAPSGISKTSELGGDNGWIEPDTGTTFRAGHTNCEVYGYVLPQTADPSLLLYRPRLAGTDCRTPTGVRQTHGAFVTGSSAAPMLVWLEETLADPVYRFEVVSARRSTTTLMPPFGTGGPIKPYATDEIARLAIPVAHDTTNKNPPFVFQYRHGAGSSLVITSPNEKKVWHVRVAPDGSLSLAHDGIPIPTIDTAPKYLTSASGELYFVDNPALGVTIHRAQGGAFVPAHRVTAETSTDGVAPQCTVFLPEDEILLAAWRGVSCGEDRVSCYEITFAKAE